MERVHGMDAAFLSLEGGDNHFHVAQACVFDPNEASQPHTFEAVRSLIASRLDRLPPFRRRLVESPLGFGQPAWIEDPDFDLDAHLYEVHLPHPGGSRELADFTSSFISRRLDRSRPLWEMAVVDGLEGGLVAGVTKIHHSTVDGISGSELTANLLDVEPDPPQINGDTPRWAPERYPSLWQQARSAAGAVVRQPMDMARTSRRVAAAGLRLAVRNRAQGALVPPAPFSAPSTSFDTTVGPDRRVAFTRLDLLDVTAVKDRFEVKLNDVVLAVCAGAVRDLLVRQGSLPSDDLVAAVPVSVRDRMGGEREEVNQLSAMLVGLATSIDDPAERLAMIAAGSRAAKAQDRLLGPTTISEVAGLLTPLAGAAIRRLASATGIMHRPRPLVNVVVSAYPGPAIPLYCVGARLVAPYPLGPIIDGASINITAQTYLDAMHVGIVTSARGGPDPWDLAHGLSDALGDLIKVAA